MLFSIGLVKLSEERGFCLRPMKKRQQKREEKKRNHLAQLYTLDTRWSPVQHEHTENPFLTHTSRTRNNEARRSRNHIVVMEKSPRTRVLRFCSVLKVWNLQKFSRIQDRTEKVWTIKNHQQLMPRSTKESEKVRRSSWQSIQKPRSAVWTSGMLDRNPDLNKHCV